MYNVIIVLDESRDKSYYYSYVVQNGNIECEDLPPYQDINKARSCYWDGNAWIYDGDKYAELVAAQAEAAEAAEQERQEAEAVPTNAELAAAVMELADNENLIMDAITEIACKVAALKGGE